MSNWNLFIDDIRDPSYVNDGREYVLARSVKEAISLIEDKGLPAHIAFDHDLGWEDLPNITGSFLISAPIEGEEAQSGMDLARWLIDKSIDGVRIIPSTFTWSVHSSNPVGKDNINGLLSGYMEYASDSNDISLAIEHAIEVSKKPGLDCDCARQHLQLANWLTELKTLRNQNT